MKPGPSALPGLILALHTGFPELVDWKALAVPGQSWMLVTDPFGAGKLSPASLGNCQLTVIREFTFDALDRLVRRIVGDKKDPRLVTMQEHLQMTTARLRERLGLKGPSPRQIEPFTDKRTMKRGLGSLGDFLPRWRDFDTGAYAADPDAWLEGVLAKVGLPAFVKPVSSVSSEGTAKVHSKQELKRYLDAAARAVEIDEYIVGAAAYHLDSVVRDGEVLWFGAGRYLHPSYDALQGAPYIDILLGRDTPEFSDLFLINERVIRALRPPDGCTHMEVLREESGRYRFLEIGARPAGLRMPEMYRIHQGVDLRLLHYQLQAGQEPGLSPASGPLAASYHSFKLRPGKVARTFHPTLASPHHSELFEAWLGQEKAVRSTGLADILTSEVFWNKDESVLWEDIERLRTFVPYQLEE